MAAFALTPASAITGVIDFITSEGRKLYNSATYKLDEDPYDCQPDGLYQFLATLHTRAQEYGWNEPIGGILQIPENANDISLNNIYFKSLYLRSGVLKIPTSHNRYAQLKTHSCSSNA
jgi:hypothetical protein